jgi:hypothetical protein
MCVYRKLGWGTRGDAHLAIQAHEMVVSVVRVHRIEVLEGGCARSRSRAVRVGVVPASWPSSAACTSRRRAGSCPFIFVGASGTTSTSPSAPRPSSTYRPSSARHALPAAIFARIPIPSRALPRIEDVCLEEPHLARAGLRQRLEGARARGPQHEGERERLARGAHGEVCNTQLSWGARALADVRRTRGTEGHTMPSTSTRSTPRRPWPPNGMSVYPPSVSRAKGSPRAWGGTGTASECAGGACRAGCTGTRCRTRRRWHRASRT